MTDFAELFSQWQTLMLLFIKDRETLVTKLHPQTLVGIETLARIGTDNAITTINDIQYKHIAPYKAAIGTALAGAGIAGYSLYLLSKHVNPLEVNLKERNLDNLKDVVIATFANDQNEKRIASLTNEYKLLCEHTGNAFINQLMALHKESIDLPYKIVEGVHQYVQWAVLQGYCLGLLEEEITSPAK